MCSSSEEVDVVGGARVACFEAASAVGFIRRKCAQQGNNNSNSSNNNGRGGA